MCSSGLSLVSRALHNLGLVSSPRAPHLSRHLTPPIFRLLFIISSPSTTLILRGPTSRKPSFVCSGRVTALLGLPRALPQCAPPGFLCLLPGHSGHSGTFIGCPLGEELLGTSALDSDRPKFQPGFVPCWLSDLGHSLLLSEPQFPPLPCPRRLPQLEEDASLVRSVLSDR